MEYKLGFVRPEGTSTRMKVALLVFALVAAAQSSVVPVNTEEKVADAEFLKRQKQVLDLYVGLPNYDAFENEFSKYEFPVEDFTDPHVVERLFEVVKHGFLPKKAVFSLNCHHTLYETVSLFDVFFFAKDFDTFYKAASWARAHVNPAQFCYAYSLALVHRDDCHDYELPPFYEVFPHYFAPHHVVDDLYNDVLLGVKEKKYEYNNTGYEFNYHSGMFGGPLSLDAYSPHLEYKVSYFREDVGANAFYAMWHLQFPPWFCPKKYHKSHWFKEGETFYYLHQQLFARYTVERLANGLPYVEPLYWEKPLKTGYNPRVTHFNRVPFYTRPDDVVPKQLNKFLVHKAQVYEERLYDVVHGISLWPEDSHNLTFLNNEEGTDLLGKLVYGASTKEHKDYFGQFWHTSLNALGYVVKTSNDRNYVGGALTSPLTSLRDPAFYNFLNRVVKLFQSQKKKFHPYMKKDLDFPGVDVEDFHVDELVTYFDHFDYEVTNAVPVRKADDYKTLHFSATQYRLNHKPFHYNVTVKSDKEHYGMVKVFLGPKYDSLGHELNLEQKRLALYELDRFPVNLVPGVNVLTRSSKESPFFTEDKESFRQMYNRLERAMEGKETFHVKKCHCGVPDRFQLPVGTQSGHPYSVYVVVTPVEKTLEVHDGKKFYLACGSPKLYDSRPFGFPFDRPVHEHEFHLDNLYHKDVLVFHRTEHEVNRVL
ncbi:hexamerin-like [Cimex lectularius]|uniref:Hexamerin n=1 Tax=Cimex lectularius TaxID=79782 RepID=A0A8I6RDC0_CIMLE|nr:hexamerin-like [Cimex lectularius]